MLFLILLLTRLFIRVLFVSAELAIESALAFKAELAVELAVELPLATALWMLFTFGIWLLELLL